MSMMPAFSPVVLLAAVAIFAISLMVALGATQRRQGSGSALQNQGVAWAITALMIVCAIGIGRAKAKTAYTPAPEPTRPPSVAPAVPASTDSLVHDEAGVLSSSTEKELDRRNEKLLRDMDTAIAVVTCNYGRNDLDSYALDQAEELGLGEYDFIVVLDISGENYWLVQGAGLYNEGWFSDDDCTDYAVKYMKKDFIKGDYDGAVLSLTEALEEWYYDNY